MPLPLPPVASVRDFYAFEQHVKTCRGHRGLDMLPQWYQVPVFYFSNPVAIIGDGDPVWAPQGSTALDYELELACVIGTAARDLPTDDSAMGCVAGFTVMNDWSARDLQRAEMAVGLGPSKSKDFATSLGPRLVPFAENETVITVGIITVGALLGINNTLVTEAVMGAAPVERPVASAAYSFVRFTGGAIGPYVAMKLFEHEGVHAPFWFGAIAIAIGVVIIAVGAPVIRRALHGGPPAAHSAGEAEAELVGDLACGTASATTPRLPLAAGALLPPRREFVGLG
jgi:fumarylacetoacetate (FAA) hydrolase